MEMMKDMLGELQKSHVLTIKHIWCVTSSLLPHAMCHLSCSLSRGTYSCAQLRHDDNDSMTQLNTTTQQQQQKQGVHSANSKHGLLPAPTTQSVSGVHISATLEKTSLLLECLSDSLHSDCKTQQNLSIPQLSSIIVIHKIPLDNSFEYTSAVSSTPRDISCEAIPSRISKLSYDANDRVVALTQYTASCLT